MHESEQTNAAIESRLRVLIADDRVRSRDGLQMLLATYPQIEVTGAAIDGRQAIELVEEQEPDVVLMDLQMPTMDGLDATKVIKRKNPEIKIIILTIRSDRRADALNAGADAFISKGEPPERLLETLWKLQPTDGTQ